VQGHATNGKVHAFHAFNFKLHQTQMPGLRGLATWPGAPSYLFDWDQRCVEPDHREFQSSFPAGCRSSPSILTGKCFPWKNAAGKKPLAISIKTWDIQNEMVRKPAFFEISKFDAGAAHQGRRAATSPGQSSLIKPGQTIRWVGFPSIGIFRAGYAHIRDCEGI
jgi:hypothetical protein